MLYQHCLALAWLIEHKILITPQQTQLLLDFLELAERMTLTEEDTDHQEQGGSRGRHIIHVYNYSVLHDCHFHCNIFKALLK